jgi:hypothetical protein
LRQLLVRKIDLTLDPLGALLARELITRPAYDAGNLYGAFSVLSRKDSRLADGSLTGHYRKVIANGFGLLVDTPGVWTGTDPDQSRADRLEAGAPGWRR